MQDYHIESAGEQYILIRNWDKFQHYKQPRPKWIKSYTDLIFTDEYVHLSPHRRAMLHGLWLLFATCDGTLRLDTRYLSRSLNLRVTVSDLESLNHAGFIEVCSRETLYQSKSKSKREEKELTSTTERTELRGALHPATEEVIGTLAGIPKDGYSAVKFTHERLSTLLAKFPNIDHVHQAECLRDWEMFGGGEGKATKDGIARLRNWLKNCSQPLATATSPDPYAFITEAGYKILGPDEHL